MSYKNKYLKYKLKYLNLKKKLRGSMKTLPEIPCEAKYESNFSGLGDDNPKTTYAKSGSHTFSYDLLNPEQVQNIPEEALLEEALLLEAQPNAEAPEEEGPIHEIWDVHN